MGQIVDGGRTIPIGRRVGGFRGRGVPTDPLNNPHINRFNCKMTIPGAAPRKTYVIERGGKMGEQVMQDLTVVREHMGLNISDALRISLHLTANAIRSNRARVEVE